MKVVVTEELREWNRIYKEMDRIYHGIAARMGLSDTAFMVLYGLCELGEGCLQKDICDHCWLSKQTVHSAIRKLEQQGLLQMRPGKGRDMHLHLTPGGEQLVRQKILPVFAAENGAFVAMDEKNRSQLLQLSREYTDRLRQETANLL